MLLDKTQKQTVQRVEIQLKKPTITDDQEIKELIKSHI